MERSRAVSEAEEYELFDCQDTTLQDCNFLEQVFKTWRPGARRLLDIACGTGRHTIEMTRRGYQVTGIDLSEDILVAARQKAAENQSDVAFFQQDMTSLAFSTEFDAAYILFNTIFHLIRNDDLIRLMNGVGSALLPSGLLIIETVNFWGDIASRRVANTHLHWDEEKAGLKRHWEAAVTVCPVNNIILRQDEKQFWRDGVELQPKSKATYLRVFSFNEFDLLCRLTGYKISAVYGDTDTDQLITDPYRVTDSGETYKSYVFVLQKE